MNELTEAEIQELRCDILALQEQIETLLKNSAAEAAPVDLEKPIGRLSRMDALQQQGMAKMQRQNHQVRLQQLGRALQSIAGGEYGFCVECEESIGYSRLKARPEAFLCRSCQSKREQLNR